MFHYDLLPKSSLYQYRDLKYYYLNISRKLDVKLNHNWQKKNNYLISVITLHVDSCKFLNLRTCLWYKLERIIWKTNVKETDLYRSFRSGIAYRNGLQSDAQGIMVLFCSKQGQETIPPKPSDRLWQSLSPLMNGYRASFTREKAAARNEFI